MKQEFHVRFLEEFTSKVTWRGVNLLMKKVIVTGANGFIGRNLVQSLIVKGYQVTALVLQRGNINDAGISYVCVKDKELEQIAEELNDKYECIYHLAWAGTSGAMRADYKAQLKNVQLSCDYVRLAALIDCPRIIYASSINEIETYEYLQSNDVEPSMGYIYGAAKLSAHLMAETLAYNRGVDFIPVIITNIYGVGEKSARLIYTSILKLLRGERCSFTEGKQFYDFIYITDAINSIIEVAEKGQAFNRYYIGSGMPRPLREFLIKMRDVVAPNAVLGLGDMPFRGVSVDYQQFNMEQVEKDTGYKNRISFERGIQYTLEYIREEEGL